MYQPVNIVEVVLWGDTVGAVALDPGTGYYAFEYSDKWISKGIELSPLQMPLRSNDNVFIYPNLPVETFKRLPAMLADALPDDFGNALIDAYMAIQGVEKSAITSLDRLAYMANRSMGALEFKPPRSPKIKGKPSAVEISKLVEGSRKALSGRFEGDAETEAAILNIIQVGTSAGGARAKAVIAWNAETGEIRSGQLPVQEGFEHWLLKLDGVGRDNELGTGADYGRIEYAYHLMAAEADIDMSECRILEENGRAHFMTKRFDRNGNIKHHMQTLCGMNHLDFKQRATHDYSQLFMTMKLLGLDHQLEQSFRRMVFNVAASNCDDHTKNFSFILKRGEKWSLSPAYDITHAYNPKGEWNYQHLMSVNGKFKDILVEDMLVMADRFHIPNAKENIETVMKAIKRWPEFAEKAGLSNKMMREIADDFPRI